MSFRFQIDLAISTFELLQSLHDFHNQEPRADQRTAAYVSICGRRSVRAYEAVLQFSREANEMPQR